jgi:hypothetical protein
MLQRNRNVSSNKVESFGVSHLMNILKKLTNLLSKRAINTFAMELKVLRASQMITHTRSQ